MPGWQMQHNPSGTRPWGKRFSFKRLPIKYFSKSISWMFSLRRSIWFIWACWNYFASHRFRRAVITFKSWFHLFWILARDGRPSRRGRGGSPPRPALWGGGGSPPRPAPPRKNDQNRREVAGQNKYPNLNFLQKRKEVMEQYYNTEQCPIKPVNRICKYLPLFLLTGHQTLFSKICHHMK